ncbi:hypothetical protein LCGC14_2670510, partial [marine sediment metagenome]
NGNGKNQLFLGLKPDIISVTEITLSEVVLSTTLFSFDANSVFRAVLATAQCKAVEGITLSGTDPVQIDLTAHGFITGETARLISMVGISPSLDGEYGVTKINIDAFTLNGTDSSDYSGSFTSGTACFATLAELHYLTDETPDGYFPKGVKNVKITGTYGWASTPAGVTQAAILLCKADNDPALYPSYSGTLKSERLGDYSYTVADASKVLTGIDRVDKFLTHYVRRKPILGAV